VLAGVAAALVVPAAVVAVTSSRGGTTKQPAPGRAEVGHDDDANLMRRLQRTKLVKR